MGGPSRGGASRPTGREGARPLSPQIPQPAVDADPVEVLVSGMGPEQVDLSRRVTTALRLLASDGGGHDSPSMCVHPASAREEYERHELWRIEEGLEALAVHVFRTLVHRDSMLWLPSAAAGYSESWANLLRLTTDRRRKDLGIAVPDPREGALEVLDGLLDSLASVRGEDVTPARLARGQLWAARLELAGCWARSRGHRPSLAPPAYAQVQEQLAEARRRLEAAHGAGRATAEGARVARELRASQLALALDARRPGDVADLIDGMPAVPDLLGECRDGGDAVGLFARWFAGRLAVLPALTEDRARELGIGAGAWIERASWEASGELEVSPVAGAANAPALPVDRRLIGARAVVVCRIDGRSGAVDVVRQSVAPALKGHVESWCASRRYAVGEAGAPEHEAIRNGGPFAASTVPPGAGEFPMARAAIGAARGVPAPRSLLVEPVLEGGGRAVGYVWVEADHGLFPGPEQRAALVQGARAAIARVSERAPDPVPTTPLRRGARRAPTPLPGDTGDGSPADRELQTRWDAIVDHLRIKLAERRWVAFHPGRLEGAAPRAVATGGEGDVGALRAEVSASVVRCFQTGGVVRVGGPQDPSGSTQFEAGVSGAVLPVRSRGEVLAALCVESSRRSDPRDRDARRWGALLEELAPGVLAARLDEADRLARRGGVALDPGDPAAHAWLGRIERLATSSVDVLVYGEPGSGRATTARALAHRRTMSGSAGRLHPFAAAGLALERVEAVLRGDPADTVLVTDVQRATPALADRLGSLAREGIEGRARIVMTSSAQEGGALARALGLAAYQTTPLRARRQWIPALAEGLLRRVAWGEGMEAPSIGDDAMAQLWRQDWQGNASELASVLNTALCADGGGELSLDAVLAAMGECHVEPVRKRASRNPAPAEVASALWLTRTASSRINKSRAALYLGWDPATVSTKMAALEIETPADALGQLME